jgi:hypothetical protein
MSCALTLALNTYSAESVSYPNTFEVEATLLRGDQDKLCLLDFPPDAL